MRRGSLRPDVEGLLIWRLAQVLRRERPHLIHNFTIKCAVYGSLAAILAGIPNRINTVAGLGYVFTSNDPKARVLAPDRGKSHAARVEWRKGSRHCAKP